MDSGKVGFLKKFSMKLIIKNSIKNLIDINISQMEHF